jgi:hypothetical protein
MKRLSSIILIFGVTVGFSGCATSLGQFTVISSNNVRHLNYSIEDKTKVRTEGSACSRNLFGFIPISQQDDLLQRAIDNAISNGQDKGIDGDLLVNGRITYEPTTLVIYNDLCYSVKGDLVKIDTK